ncbi:MAG: hypothetical protein Q9211_001163 [Gyalolechia sp. 1 TL-2023]
MVRIPSSLAFVAVFTSVLCAPLTRNAPVATRNFLAKRSGGEPWTVDDDFPDVEPHPNDLDKVEGAFHDVAELAAFAIDELSGSDNTIFLNYFNEGDKDDVKKVFETVLGTTKIGEDPSTGNDLLSNIHVQKTDTNNLCGGRTLAYLQHYYDDDDTVLKAYIVLCPPAFKKKGVTAINGAENPADNDEDANFYIQCETLRANGHVSYLMNSLGATLLHEYLHYDTMIEPVLGKRIIDEDDGYGPVNVYAGGALDRSKAITNADSYTYFALETLWTVLCSGGGAFEAPRAGIDDADPDCGDESCTY